MKEIALSITREQSQICIDLYITSTAGGGMLFSCSTLFWHAYIYPSFANESLGSLFK